MLKLACNKHKCSPNDDKLIAIVKWSSSTHTKAVRVEMDIVQNLFYFCQENCMKNEKLAIELWFICEK